MLPPSFKPIGLLVQEEKRKIDGSHHGFPTGMILAIFDLQVTSMLSNNF